MCSNQFNLMKRIIKLTREMELDLTFDLINAISLVNNPTKAALLLEDLLTSAEIRNISKRLRIAKLILEGKTQVEVIDEIHCSFGTIAKVSVWLKKAGNGLKEVIRNLPKRHEKVDLVGQKYRIYRLPEALLENYLNLLANDERKRVEKLLKNSEDKKELFDKIEETFQDFYKDKSSKNKNTF